MPLEDQMQFSYNKIWSDQLRKQLEQSVHRFIRYIESPEAIKNEEITKFKKIWMKKAIDLVPENMIETYSV